MSTPPPQKRSTAKILKVIFTNKTCLIPNCGFQSFFRVFTQISPFLATFGWKIFVRKYAFGGSDGKFELKTSFILNCPPEYGVPATKKQTFHIEKHNDITIILYNYKKIPIQLN